MIMAQDVTSPGMRAPLRAMRHHALQAGNAFFADILVLLLAERVSALIALSELRCVIDECACARFD